MLSSMGINHRYDARSDTALLLCAKNLALNYLGACQRQPTKRWSPTLRAKGGIVESHVEVEE